MPSRLRICFAMLGASAWVIAAAHAAEPGECTKAQIAPPATAIGWDEVVAHRRFRLPTVDYAFGTRLEGGWGLTLALRVDAQGRVVCHAFEGREDEQSHARLSALIASSAHWRYAPFLRNGKPVAASIYERIGEQELPERHVPLPAAPLADTAITLERTACYGRCPVYTIELRGDGRAVYSGRNFVAGTGKREVRVSPADVAALVDAIRQADLWSLRPAYQAGVTDLPSAILTIRVGSQTHRIVDYAGEWVGMPHAVVDIEQQVDRIGGTDRWIFPAEARKR